MELKRIKVLFVCMGNICRSPTVEAVFRRKLEQAGLEAVVDCDSAGTHNYHIGEPPDERAQRSALKRGYDMKGLRGRQVGCEDFERFDYVLAMDRENLALLERLCPRQHRGKLALFCDYHEAHAGKEVPDPYFGGEDGFEHVLDLAEEVAQSLIDRMRREMPA